MAEFRAVPAEDRDRWREILTYAFRPQLGPVEQKSGDDWPPSLFDQRGLYMTDELVSTCKLYHFDASIRGDTQTVGGIGAVATAPEHRGNGYVSELCRSALEEYHENDVGFGTLWPFETRFYAALGWGVANRYNRYQFDPSVLPVIDADGRMVRLSAAEWERLRPVETAFANGTGLSMRRSEEWWQERTLANWDGGGEPYLYGYERDSSLAGYLIYTVDDDEHRTLSITDLAYVDDEAHSALLTFLGNHGAQINRITLSRSTESSLLHRVSEPEEVECVVKTGPMVRLTGLAALESIDWPAVDLTCTMAVSDPLLDRIDGQYELSVTSGTATVTPLTSNENTNLSVDIATLSQLAVGTYDIGTAMQVGDLTIESPSLRDSLAELFTAEPVCLREFF